MAAMTVSAEVVLPAVTPMEVTTPFTEERISPPAAVPVETLARAACLSATSCRIFCRSSVSSFWEMMACSSVSWQESTASLAVSSAVFFAFSSS